MYPLRTVDTILEEGQISSRNHQGPKTAETKQTAEIHLCFVAKRVLKQPKRTKQTIHFPSFSLGVQINSHESASIALSIKKNGDRERFSFPFHTIHNSGIHWFCFQVTCTPSRIQFTSPLLNSGWRTRVFFFLISIKHLFTGDSIKFLSRSNGSVTRDGLRRRRRWPIASTYGWTTVQSYRESCCPCYRFQQCVVWRVVPEFNPNTLQKASLKGPRAVFKVRTSNLQRGGHQHRQFISNFPSEVLTPETQPSTPVRSCAPTPCEAWVSMVPWKFSACK